MNLLFDRRLTDKVVWVVFLGSNWNYKCECEKPVSHDTIEPNFDSVKFNTLTQKWMCFFMMKMCVCDLRIVWVTFDRPDSKILWKLYIYILRSGSHKCDAIVCVSNKHVAHRINYARTIQWISDGKPPNK